MDVALKHYFGTLSRSVKQDSKLISYKSLIFTKNIEIYDYFEIKLENFTVYNPPPQKKIKSNSYVNTLN